MGSVCLFKLEFSPFLDIQPDVELLDRTATLLFNFFFLQNLHPVLRSVCTIHVLTNSEGGFIFLGQSVYSTVT